MQLEHYGGGEGLRDLGGLEAAVARPAMTFAGEDLYLDIPGKASALMHSLVMNHPFVDGNKRVGAHAALIFLMANGWDITATSSDLEEVTLSLAQSKLDIESLTIWFSQRARPG
jgi:death-on-curing protein